MINTTLCYIERDGQYLMLYRNKKENDPNQGKWIGVGGKFLENESPGECVCREVLEETGLTLISYRYRGIITFVSDRWESEQMHLFTADGFTGDLIPCDEGELRWVKKEDIMGLNLWEGDRLFLKRLMEDDEFFTMKLVYEGDTLVENLLD